jgi:vacuolar-type H+-ATPase subunit H
VVVTIDILEFADRLEALASAGWHIPFTVRTAIDENAFFDILDQIRISVPQEIKQAKELLQKKEEILAEATAQAGRVVEEAKEKASRLLDDDEINAAARVQAETIKAQAHREVDQICRGADDYALGTLSDLESRLSSLLRTTSNGLATLRRRQAQKATEEPESTS